MRNRRKIRLAIACGVALIATSLSLADGVGAAEEPQRTSSEIAAVAEAAAGDAGAPASVEGETVTADLGATDVEVPLDPDGGLVVDADGGPEVTIGLPVASASTGTPVGGTVVYEDAAPATALVARPTDEGVQALVVIEGADAPTEYRFPIEVGRGGEAELTATVGGAIEVRTPGTPTPVALVLPAWATDADGRPVPTHFEIDGGTLVQVVDHAGAAYPVVADPLTCGLVTCTYYFGKQATRDMRTAGGVAAVCGHMDIAKVLKLACVAAGAAISIQAFRAVDRGMCVKLKYRWAPPIAWWPDIYRGKHCK